MMKLWFGLLLMVSVGVTTGCSMEHDPPEFRGTVARFDPEEGVIPLPSDALLDEELGRLDLPIEDDMTAAEVAFREYLNEGDAWSSTFPGSVEFSAPIDLDTVTAETLQIWDWTNQPTRLGWEWDHLERSPGFEGPIVVLNDEGDKLSVDPPRAGWILGGRYVMLVRGGATGVRDAQGGLVSIDKAFFFLRLRKKLDTYQNNRAFPGDSIAERLDTASKLEEMRLKLAPIFDYFESANLPADQRIARDDLVALWSFTVTTRAELAMDRPSQRMPIPFDLLIDPDTGLVDLKPAPWDDELEADAKVQINEMAGFAVSANLMFETTRPISALTATIDNIQLYELDSMTTVPLERVMVMTEEGEEPCHQSPVDPGCKHLVVVVEPDHLPLKPQTSYALVVHDGLRTVEGDPISPMLIGHFMRSDTPLLVNGVNQLDSLTDDLAERLETSRAKIDGLLDYLGRNDVITAWPFTTMLVPPNVETAIDTAATLETPVEPVDIQWKTLDAFNKDEAFESLFPGTLAFPVREIYATRLTGVARVVEGAIPMPYLLDRVTRRFRPNGEYELENVRFVMTIPETAGPSNPAPVMIFGHAVTTDRRFVLTIGGELAQKGFAAIAIDFPFHGERTVCVDATLVAIPNFLSEELKDLLDYHDNLIMLPPCMSGENASCSPTGQCLDADGNPEPFNNLLTFAGKPAVFDYKPASGAAFLDIDDIPYISDHFLQAVIDLGSLKRSLQLADWEHATGGYPIRTDRFYYAGQSLGAIIGAVYVAVDPDIERAVLNVPGGDMVDLFMDSIYFGPQFDDFFVREKIVEGSFEQERLLNIARWLIDSVDPHSVAHLYRTNGTPTLLQMDSGWPTGDIVIPNEATRVLQRVSGLPLREYNSILHADLVIPLLGDLMLKDMADFLAGEINE